MDSCMPVFCLFSFRFRILSFLSYLMVPKTCLQEVRVADFVFLPKKKKKPLQKMPAVLVNIDVKEI